MSDDLFDLVVRLPRATSTLRRFAPHCAHDRIDLDVNARRVRCGACGVELDPIAVLFNFTTWFRAQEDREQEHDQLAHKILANRAELVELEAEVRERERKVANLKEVERLIQRDIEALNRRKAPPRVSERAPSDGASSAAPAAPPSVARRGRRLPESAG